MQLLRKFSTPFFCALQKEHGLVTIRCSTSTSYNLNSCGDVCPSENTHVLVAVSASSFLVYFCFKPCSCFAVEAPLGSSATRIKSSALLSVLWWDRAAATQEAGYFESCQRLHSGSTLDCLKRCYNATPPNYCITLLSLGHMERLSDASPAGVQPASQSPDDWPSTKMPLTHVLRLLDKTSCSHWPIHQATSAKAFSIPNASL